MEQGRSDMRGKADLLQPQSIRYSRLMKRSAKLFEITAKTR